MQLRNAVPVPIPAVVGRAREGGCCVSAVQSESCCHTSTSDSSLLQDLFLPRVELVSEILTPLDPFFPTVSRLPANGTSVPSTVDSSSLMYLRTAVLYRYLALGSRRGGTGRVCSLTVVAITTIPEPYIPLLYGTGSFDPTHHHHCSIFLLRCTILPFSCTGQQ